MTYNKPNRIKQHRKKTNRVEQTHSMRYKPNPNVTQKPQNKPNLGRVEPLHH